MSIKAMKLALEALEYFSDTSPTMAGKAHAEDAITALRTAIEQAEKQEPVAYSVGRTLHWHEGRGVSDAQLYTTPPAQPAPVQEPVAWREAVLDLIDDCPGLTMEQDHWLTRRVKEIDAPSAAQQEHEPENEPHVSLASVREDWGPGPHEVHSLPAQRQWVGLTDADVYQLANEHLHYQTDGYEVSGVYNLARAIEAKLKEKNSDR